MSGISKVRSENRGVQDLPMFRMIGHLQLPDVSVGYGIPDNKDFGQRLLESEGLSQRSDVLWNRGSSWLGDSFGAELFLEVAHAADERFEHDDAQKNDGQCVVVLSCLPSACYHSSRPMWEHSLTKVEDRLEVGGSRDGDQSVAHGGGAG